MYDLCCPKVVLPEFHSEFYCGVNTRGRTPGSQKNMAITTLMRNITIKDNKDHVRSHKSIKKRAHEEFQLLSREEISGFASETARQMSEL